MRRYGHLVRLITRTLAKTGYEITVSSSRLADGTWRRECLLWRKEPYSESICLLKTPYDTDLIPEWVYLRCVGAALQDLECHVRNLAHMLGVVGTKIRALSDARDRCT